MRTLKAASYVSRFLAENYKRGLLKWDKQNPGIEFYTIEEWCNLEAESDPDFYRWLFNDGDISDFGSDLTDEEKEIASDYFGIL